MKDPRSYLPKPPPPGAHHRELTNGECKVLIVPMKWRTFHGEVKVTECCAWCKTCGWDTPKLFSMSATEAAAKRHLGLLPLAGPETLKEG